MSKNLLLVRKRIFLFELILVFVISALVVAGVIRQFSKLISLNQSAPAGVMSVLINQTLSVISPPVVNTSQVELTTPLTSTYSDKVRR